MVHGPDGEKDLFDTLEKVIEFINGELCKHFSFICTKKGIDRSCLRAVLDMEHHFLIPKNLLFWMLISWLSSTDLTVCDSVQTWILVQTLAPGNFFCNSDKMKYKKTKKEALEQLSNMMVEIPEYLNVASKEAQKICKKLCKKATSEQKM